MQIKKNEPINCKETMGHSWAVRNQHGVELIKRQYQEMQHPGVCHQHFTVLKCGWNGTNELHEKGIAFLGVEILAPWPRWASRVHAFNHHVQRPQLVNGRDLDSLDDRPCASCSDAARSFSTPPSSDPSTNQVTARDV